METLKNLLSRLRQTGVLLLIGIFVIIYVALGFLYFQQGAKQKRLEDEIAKYAIILANPLPSAEELQADYETVIQSLVPRPTPEILAAIVDLASESGIDVNPDSGKLTIPPPKAPVTKTVGGTSYQVQTFGSVSMQGDYESVMAFISALESGEVLKTIVLKTVSIGHTEEETSAVIDIELYTKLEESS